MGGKQTHMENGGVAPCMCNIRHRSSEQFHAVTMFTVIRVLIQLWRPTILDDMIVLYFYLFTGVLLKQVWNYVEAVNCPNTSEPAATLIHSRQ